MKKIPKKSEILKNWYLFGLDVDLSILLLFFCVQSKILRIYEHFINQNYFFFTKIAMSLIFYLIKKDLWICFARKVQKFAYFARNTAKIFYYILTPKIFMASTYWIILSEGFWALKLFGEKSNGLDSKILRIDEHFINQKLIFVQKLPWFHMFCLIRKDLRFAHIICDFFNLQFLRTKRQTHFGIERSTLISDSPWWDKTREYPHAMCLKKKYFPKI